MSAAAGPYEARLGPDGRVEALLACGRGDRRVEADSPEGVAILAAGAGVVYRFDDGGTLRNLPYPEVLEGLRREVQLAAQRARRGELGDEPEALPALARLLAAITARAAEFERSRARLAAQEHREGA